MVFDNKLVNLCSTRLNIAGHWLVWSLLLYSEMLRCCLTMRVLYNIINNFTQDKVSKSIFFHINNITSLQAINVRMEFSCPYSGQLWLDSDRLGMVVCGGL